MHWQFHLEGKRHKEKCCLKIVKRGTIWGDVVLTELWVTVLLQRISSCPVWSGHEHVQNNAVFETQGGVGIANVLQSPSFSS